MTKKRGKFENLVLEKFLPAPQTRRQVSVHEVGLGHKFILEALSNNAVLFN